MSNDIRYELVFARSSEKTKDPDELTRNLLNSTGWASKKNCSFPQKIVLDLTAKTNVTRIKICPHDTYIPTKVKCFIGEPIDQVYDDMTPKDFTWTGLGSLDFHKQNNDVVCLFVDVTGRFIMLKVLEPYESKSKSRKNDYNQVGLELVKIVGYPEKETKSESVTKRDKGNEIVTRQRSLSAGSCPKCQTRCPKCNKFKK